MRMRIISTPLPAAPEDLADQRQAIVMALDTLADDKSLVVGLVEGAIDGQRPDQLCVSPVGQAVLDRCSAHHRRVYPAGAVIVAGVADSGSASQRVRQVLAKAPPEALVLLVCATGKVYDAAFTTLSIDFTAAVRPKQ
jgi:hypothetical protein